jgi:hypothetical protein
VTCRFCWYAAICTVADWALQITFFLACFVLSERHSSSTTFFLVPHFRGAAGAARREQPQASGAHLGGGPTSAATTVDWHVAPLNGSGAECVTRGIVGSQRKASEVFPKESNTRQGRADSRTSGSGGARSAQGLGGAQHLGVNLGEADEQSSERFFSGTMSLPCQPSHSCFAGDPSRLASQAQAEPTEEVCCLAASN